MNWQDYIHSDPGIVGGKPVVKGTRLSVEFILERLADGWSHQTLLENYPRLTQDSLLAVYAYMLEIAKDGVLYNPPASLKQAS